MMSQLLPLQYLKTPPLQPISPRETSQDVVVASKAHIENPYQSRPHEHLLFFHIRLEDNQHPFYKGLKMDSISHFKRAKSPYKLTLLHTELSLHTGLPYRLE